MNRTTPSTSKRKVLGKGLAIGIVAAAALAVLGLAAYKYLFNRPGEAAAMLIPSDADVVVTLDTNPSERQIATFKKITDALEREGIAKKLDDAMSGFLDGQPIGAEVRPHLKRSFAMALWVKGEGSPDMVTLCAVDDAGAVREALRKHGKPKSDGIYSIDAAGNPLVAGVIEGYLALSNSETVLARVERVRSGSEQSVSRLPAFGEARAALPPDANLMVFLSPKVFQTFERQMKGTMGAGAFRTTQWMAYGATIVDEGIAFDYSCPMDSNQMQALRQLGRIEPFNLDALRRLPEGAYGVFGYSQAGKYWNVIEETVRSEESAKQEFDRGVDEFEKETGLDVADDLVPAFQGEQILAIYPGPSGNLQDVDAMLMLTEANGADPAALAAKLRGILERKTASDPHPVRFVESKIGNHTIWEIDSATRAAYTEGPPSGMAPRSLPPSSIGDQEPGPDLSPDVHQVPSLQKTPEVEATGGVPEFLQGKSLAYAAVGNSVLITSSRALLNRTLEVAGAGRTLADDAAFSSMKAHVLDGSQTVLLVNLHRIFKAFEPAKENASANGPFELSDLARLFGDGLVGLVASGRFDGRTATGRMLLPLDFETGIRMLGETLNAEPKPGFSSQEAPLQFK